MVTFRPAEPAAPSAPTPEEALAKINAAHHNPDDLYHAQHAGKIGHDERVAEVRALFEAAYPERPPGAEEPPAVAMEEAGEAQALPALPEGMAWDRTTVSEFKGLAEDLGLAPERGAQVLSLEAECWAKEPPTSEETLALLQEEWGSEFNRKLSAAQWLVQHRVPPALQAALERSGLGDHPEMIRLAAEVGERLLAHLKRAEALQADRQGPYWNPSHPGYQAARAEWSRCFELVYGTRRVG